MVKLKKKKKKKNAVINEHQWKSKLPWPVCTKEDEVKNGIGQWLHLKLHNTSIKSIFGITNLIYFRDI